MSEEPVPQPYTHEFYRQLLQAGMAAGYRFITFDQLAEARASGGKFCLLRHDCEGDLIAASQLASIEADMGVRSTYFVMIRSVMYNLFSPPNLHLVRGILSLGHCLGLHFDEKPFLHLGLSELADQVERERKFLEQEFGVPVPVTSFHQPSQRVLDNVVRLSKSLNTYDRKDMTGIYYLSDSNKRLTFARPEEFFLKSPYERLQVLLHPECWNETAIGLKDLWNHALENQFNLIQESMLEREEVYKVRQQIVFKPLKIKGSQHGINA